jgi:hypothetical protein
MPSLDRRPNPPDLRQSSGARESDPRNSVRCSPKRLQLGQYPRLTTVWWVRDTIPPQNGGEWIHPPALASFCKRLSHTTLQIVWGSYECEAHLMHPVQLTVATFGRLQLVAIGRCLGLPLRGDLTGASGPSFFSRPQYRRNV